MQERGRELGYVVKRKLAGRENDSPARAARVKRVLDPVAAALGLVVLSPVYAAIAVAVVVDSGRPVSSSPPGRQGRAAVQDAEVPHHGPRRVRVGLEKGLTEDPFGIVKDDPRITPVGRWLRRPASTSCRSSSTWSPAA